MRCLYPQANINRYTSEARSPPPLFNRRRASGSRFVRQSVILQRRKRHMVAEMEATNFIKAMRHYGHREFLHSAKRNLPKELQNAVSLQDTSSNTLKQEVHLNNI
jgi:hypothetical protein